MKHLKQLRSSLLSQSLDLSTIDRDVRQHNERGWRVDRAKFTLEDTPWAARRAADHGFQARMPINLNKLLIRRQKRMLKALAVADRDYREILTSAASLTSSMQTLRTGTAALWVALVSLTVTAFTLAVAALALLLTEAPKTQPVGRRSSMDPRPLSLGCSMVLATIEGWSERGGAARPSQRSMLTTGHEALVVAEFAAPRRI
jgi:hypothetical protein